MPPLAQCDAFGFIYDQAGAPSVGTLVTLKKVVDADGNPILLGPLTTTTDATGAYHFTVPQGSTCYVSARADTLWSCNGGTAMLVPASSSGELVPAFAPPAAFGVAPPLMFIGNVLSLPRASASQDGYLSAADWNIFNAGGGAAGGVASFNGRAGAVMPISADYSSFYLPLTGGALSGPLTLAADPALPMQAATRQYVDAHTGSGGGLLPGEYLVSDFKASGSANKYSGSIGSGSTLLTSTTATDFQVGQGIYIAGAGIAGAALLTKVSAISGTSITLQNAAVTTITAVVNNIQHDDTVAIQNAINAVFAAGGGTLIWHAGIFRVNGPFTNINSILKIPYQPAAGSQLIGIRMIAQPQAFPAFQGPPNTGGTIIQTDKLKADANSSILAAAAWDPSTDWTTVNNVTLYLDGFTFRTYDNPNINALDMGMCGMLIAKNIAIDAGTPQSSAAQPTNDCFGIRLPKTNAAGLTLTENIFISNYGIGFVCSEIWSSAGTIAALRCQTGYRFLGGWHVTGGVSRLTGYQCPTMIEITAPIVLDLFIDFEQDTTGWWAEQMGRDFYDPGNNAKGMLRFVKIRSVTGAHVAPQTTGFSNVTLWNLSGTANQIAGPTTVNDALEVKNDVIVRGNIEIWDGSAIYPLAIGPNNSAAVTGYREIEIANGSAGLLAGLLSYWKLDEGSAGPWADSTGANPLHLLFGTTTSVGGKLNNGIQSNTSGFIGCADNTSLNFAGKSLSVCGWINLLDTSSTQTLIGKYSDASGFEFLLGWQAGHWQFNVSTNGSTLVTAQITATPATNTWHFLAGVFNLTTGQISISVDAGAPVITTFAGPIFHGSNSLAIGYIYFSGNVFSNLIADEIGLWQRALSTSEISELYNSGAGLSYPFSGAPPDTTPPVISAVTASALAPTSATITWNTNENSDSQVEYGTTTAYGNSTTLNTSMVTSHSVPIIGLTTSTLYHYRVKSKDAAGNLATSADFTFTTTAVDTTPPVISAVASSGLTATGATITWTTDEPADSQVEYGTTTSYGTSTTLNATLVTSHSQPLSGLTASTTYHYRVKSKDASGNLATSADFTFTTSATGTGLNAGLVSYWKFNETAAPWVDSMGVSNFVVSNATPTSATGKISNGLHVGAGTAVAGAPANTAYHFSGSMTVAGWMQVKSTQSVQSLAAKWATTTAYEFFLGYWFSNWAVLMSADGAAAANVGAAASTPTVDQWYFLAGVFDSSAGTLKLYVDGVEAASGSFAGPINPGSNPINTGFVFQSANQFSDIITDELGIWGRALTAAEITQLYNSGAGLTYPFP